MAVDNVSMDVPVKFGDSRSKGFRDIRRAGFVSNERTSMAKPIPIALRLKMVLAKATSSTKINI